MKTLIIEVRPSTARLTLANTKVNVILRDFNAKGECCMEEAFAGMKEPSLDSDCLATVQVHHMNNMPKKMIFFKRAKDQKREALCEPTSKPKLECSYSIAWRLALGICWTQPKEYSLEDSYGFLTIWIGPLAASIHFNKTKP